MSEERRKPVWPWVATLLIGLPLLYVASFGPLSWLAKRNAISMKKAWPFYWPLIVAELKYIPCIHKPLKEYEKLFTGSNNALRNMEYWTEKAELNNESIWR